MRELLEMFEERLDAEGLGGELQLGLSYLDDCAKDPGLAANRLYKVLSRIQKAKVPKEKRAHQKRAESALKAAMTACKEATRSLAKAQVAGQEAQTMVDRLTKDADHWYDESEWRY